MATYKKAVANQIILDLYDRFHRPEYLVWDPLSVVRDHAKSADHEWIALVAALLAFGGVKQIIAALQQVLERLDGTIEHGPHELARRLEGFKHRIYLGADLAMLLSLYQKSRTKYGTLEMHFETHHLVASSSVGPALSAVIADYKRWAQESDLKTGPFFSHLLNSPAAGGACKRWLMYLKWMVRADDGIDLGVWKRGLITPNQLVIPLDVHLFRISRKLGLTRLKSANWKSALQVTEALKRLDPIDPTKYDFSLCRYGMLKGRGLIQDIHKNS